MRLSWLSTVDAMLLAVWVPVTTPLKVTDIIVIGIAEVYSFRHVHLRNCQSGGFVHTSRVTDTCNALCCNISVTRLPDFSGSNRIVEVHHGVSPLSLS